MQWRQRSRAPSAVGGRVVCDAEGLFVGRVPLLERGPGRESEWRPRQMDELNRDLSELYGFPIEIASKVRWVEAIARALQRGELGHAQMATAHLRLPDPPDLGKSDQTAEDIAPLALRLLSSGVLKFNPNHQPAGSPDGIGGQFAPAGTAGASSSGSHAAVAVGAESGPGAAVSQGAPRPRPLGELTIESETGARPGDKAAAARKVSTGKGADGKPDPGGISYGAFQLTSLSGRQVQAFLNSPEGAPWINEFKGLDPTKAGAFGAKWKEIADRDSDAFLEAQQSYIQRTHYDPAVSEIKQTTGLDLSARSRAVQEAVFSTVNQHGRGRMLVVRAIHKASTRHRPSDPDYDRALVNAIYDVRTHYVLHLKTPQPRLVRRYIEERRKALAMLEQGS